MDSTSEYANISTLGISKSDVMETQAKSINPELRIEKWDAFIDESNVEAFLKGCDLVVDSLDAFATRARSILFTKAQQMGIPVVTAGPIGFSTDMLIFTPKSMS